MTQNEIDREIERINLMSREDMASLWRFAPAGHPYFVSGSPLCEAFDRRFKSLGGFSPAISKAIGLDQSKGGGA